MPPPSQRNLNLKQIALNQNYQKYPISALNVTTPRAENKGLFLITYWLLWELLPSLLDPLKLSIPTK